MLGLLSLKWLWWYVCPSAVSKPSPGAHLPAPPSTPLLSAHAAPLPEVHPQPPPYPSISRASPSPAYATDTPRLCCLSSHVHTSPPPVTTSMGGCHQALLSKTPAPPTISSIKTHTNRQEAVAEFLIDSIFFFISFQEAQH